jgi:xanthine/uracil permease
VFPLLTSCSDDCAAEAIVLGFQHYLTMLGTTVLIPTLIFRNIGGNAVRSSSSFSSS